MEHILILGGIITDQYLIVEEYPKRGEDSIIQNSFQRVGGCAINVAVTLKNLGMVPHVVSVLGDDGPGKEIHKYVKAQGLSTEAIRVCPDKKTGYCLSLVENSGERTFLTFKGCEAEFSRSLVNQELLEKTSLLFVTGYYLLDTLYADEIIQFVELAKDLGIKVMFDPGALVANICKDILIRMLKLTDFITPNESELEKVATVFSENSMDIVDRLFAIGVSTILIKNGSDGVRLLQPGSETFITSYTVESVDTSGAGDAFAGGLIYGILKGFEMERTVGFASACGAIATTVIGPHVEFSIEDIIKMAGGMN